MERVKSKEFLVTYPSTYNDNLSLEMIKSHWEDLLKKDEDKYFILSEENEDEKIKRKHFHGWFSLGQRRWLSKNNVDIKLKQPVVAIYEENVGNGNVVGYLTLENPFKKDEIVEHFEEIDEKVKSIFGNHEWKVLWKAHPNIQNKGYGKSEDMINYVIKQHGKIYTSHDLDLIKEKFKTKQKKRKIEEWPDFELMKRNGWDADTALNYLKDNYANWITKNWSRVEAGFYLLFSNTNEQFEANLNQEFWIPIQVWNWYNNELLPYIKNMNDKNWLKTNRNNRPKSLWWVGPSKTGKTTFMRSVCPNNYYFMLFDGMQNFNSNKPLTIIDDFGKEWNKYFTTWKVWAGCQTDFTFNPKYGRRRKISWGHPTAFLMNEYPIINNDNENNEATNDYIRENVIVVKTDNRKLWIKPKEEFLYKKIKISDLYYWKYLNKNNNQLETVDNKEEKNKKETEGRLDKKEEHPVEIQEPNQNEFYPTENERTQEWIYEEELPGNISKRQKINHEN